MARGVTSWGSATASVAVLEPILACARTEGVDVDALVADLGIPPSALTDPDHRISDSVHERMWQECAARTHDDLFGLHVAEGAWLGAYDVLDWAMWCSRSVADMLERTSRFYRLLCDALAITVATRGGVTHVARVSNVHGRHATECYIAWILRRMRELTGRPVVPREVHFTHPAPAEVAPLAAIFRCEVVFGSAASELLLSPTELELPIRTSKPELAAVLDRQMSKTLARLPAAGSFAGRVRAIVADTLSTGRRASLAETAGALKASTRTVQRRLLDHGTTHGDVVDSVRRELALRLLRTRGLSVTEIAFLLGFSDVSGFRRTFKRWTGQTPGRGRSLSA